MRGNASQEVEGNKVVCDAIGCKIGEDVIGNLDARGSDRSAVDIPSEELQRICIVMRDRKLGKS